MTSARASSGVSEYGKVGTAAGVEGATPHRIIQMLLDGVLARLAKAVGHCQRGEVSRKGESIGSAISIIEGLRASLDHDAGGQIAGNLDALYDYCIRQLLAANLRDDVEKLEEVHGLVREIKLGWDAIAPTRQLAEAPQQRLAVG